MEKPRVRPVLKRLLEAITGRPEADQPGSITSFWSKHKLKSEGTRTREVIGIDLSPLSSGDYEVEISVTDIASGQTARAKTDFRIVSEIGP
jgi:hypothetical protein